MKPQAILDEILVNYLNRVREAVSNPDCDSNTLRVSLATLEKFDWLNIAPQGGNDHLGALRMAVEAKRAARKARENAEEGDSLH